MKLLTVDTIDQAREKLMALAKLWPLRTETVPLNEAAGRILAEDVFASCDIPGFRRSAVDGYAVFAPDTAGAGESIPVFLKQTGAVTMGKPAEFSIRPGECAYVPTGGMLPGGADAVVMVEYAEALGGNVAVYEAVAPGAGMIEAGEDVKKGSLFLGRLTRVRPQEAGALAAVGITSLTVFAPIRLSLISTGNELVPPEQEPRPGEIRDINSHALKALALKHGYQVVSAQVLPDDEAQLEKALVDAKASSDVALISGGSSQGEKDLSAAVINRAAKPGVFTHGLSLKPGKPTILGWDEESKTLFAGLPGHPVSAMVVFELLLGWLVGAMNSEQLIIDRGQREFPIPARVSCNVPGSPGKTVCQPVILHFDNGVYSAEPVFGKSGMITTLTRADGYIIIDLNKEGLKRDESVLVHLF